MINSNDGLVKKLFVYRKIIPKQFTSNLLE